METAKNTTTAWIFDIYRGTSHDGPGLRSSVFFQGCPLRCRWCHNPEGLSQGAKVWWDQRSCIGCLACRAACPHEAIHAGENGIVLDPARCQTCGACVAACPSRALTFTARQWMLAELLDELRRDHLFYTKTGGGVTASGGECLTQPHFIAALFAALKTEGIGTALDTCGYVPWANFEKVLPATDYVLYDVKLMDRDAHRCFTGVDNTLILTNLHAIAERIRGGTLSAQLWLRTPLIPGATDTPENVAAIGAFIADELGDAVTRWELPAFNNSCTGKYRRLGQAWPYAQTPLIAAAEAERLKAAAIAAGVPAEKMTVTGLLTAAPGA